ncbi:MAG: aspartate carbamoyltransferase [Planctomycetia bacterium TMED53]|nr:MAG: aspartate carbamoyltransferase [Planctomycetia bacterium TMED53]
MTDATGWNLVEIADLSREEMVSILDRAVELRHAPPAVSASSSHLVALLFSEPSTRTSLSFQVACQRLGVSFIELPAERSSLLKGETVLDTARVLEALGAGALVVRDRSDDVIRGLVHECGAGVLNAGGGTRAHPSQALLDTLVLRDEFGSLEGRSIGILGDVVHSRVARSDIAAFTAMGAKVVLIGPKEFLPDGDWPEGVRVSHDLDAILPELDAIQILRIQHERIEGGMGLSLDDYVSSYQMNGTRLASCGSHFLVLHPGPMNRGVEISDEVADGKASRILQQVAAGVPIRMALLERALGIHRGSEEIH